MSDLPDGKDRVDMRKRAEAAWLAAEIARIDRSLAENRGPGAGVLVEALNVQASRGVRRPPAP